MEADDIYQRSQEKRRKRWEKDWAFKRIFYQKIDEMLVCELLEDLQPTIEDLVCFGEQVDGVSVYQPLHGVYLSELEYFLYGLLNWSAIKSLVLEHGLLKQADIINQLGLDKEKTGFFLYTLDKMGVLKKQKQGRHNAYSYVTGRISESRLKNGWNLFDVSKRAPTE
jgi:hypothetical protein